ncbi:Crustapain [Tritrichomonas foetus]|uniref:Crustapain n=1 Tax=Tritrichomonas foetus TaxID=1144522 RepID=A0A1J4JPQ5_9EUKA|nr:Crustapain [Tritrichomonas foetus]|eukprot:OHT01089.1 Crustapain [Tritrichomonas foetus]
MFALFSSLAFSALVLQHEEKSFLSWMRSSNQFYTGDEYQFRLGIWLANQRLVQEHNSKVDSFKLSMNRFAAYTPSEYRSLLGFKQSTQKSVKKPPVVTKPSNSDSLDWRELGAVSPIQDQGSCGSCWAFSAVVCFEGAEFLKHNVLYKFSEQFLVDCSTEDHGCDGGMPYHAYEYVIQQCGGKVMLNSDYPYKGIDDDCKFDENKAVGHFARWYDVKQGSESELASYLEQYGPTSVGIDASTIQFQLYTSGIFNDPKCSQIYLNHGIGLVGYGVDGDVGYWIVRNSWGAAWGEQGYARFLRGHNMCGLATSATVVESD